MTAPFLLKKDRHINACLTIVTFIPFCLGVIKKGCNNKEKDYLTLNKII